MSKKKRKFKDTVIVVFKWALVTVATTILVLSIIRIYSNGLLTKSLSIAELETVETQFNQYYYKVTFDNGDTEYYSINSTVITVDSNPRMEESEGKTRLYLNQEQFDSVFK